MAARPPVPAPPLKGGCLCGAARYRLTVRPLAINACHCTDCKRLSGVDAAILLHMPRAAVLRRAPAPCSRPSVRRWSAHR